MYGLALVSLLSILTNSHTTWLAIFVANFNMSSLDSLIKCPEVIDEETIDSTASF